MEEIRGCRYVQRISINIVRFPSSLPHPPPAKADQRPPVSTADSTDISSTSRKDIFGSKARSLTDMNYRPGRDLVQQLVHVLRPLRIQFYPRDLQMESLQRRTVLPETKRATHSCE